MTTDVQERLVLPAVAPRRMHGLRAWIVFLAGVVLAALVIGVIAAVFGNAVKALDGANAASAAAQTSLTRAETELQVAQAAESAAEAEIEARRQAIIDDLRSQPQTTTLSINPSSPAFAEVRAMEDSLQANEVAAVEAASAARADAEAALAQAADDATSAQATVDAVAQPLWIASIASGLILLILLGVAVWMSRRPTSRR